MSEEHSDHSVGDTRKKLSVQRNDDGPASRKHTFRLTKMSVRLSSKITHLFGMETTMSWVLKRPGPLGGVPYSSRGETIYMTVVRTS